MMLLEIGDLMKAFGGFQATAGVNLSVEKGSLCALIGPNGAGKTTLFNQITGYLVPDSGRIVFKGQEITGLHPYQITARGSPAPFRSSTSSRASRPSKAFSWPSSPNAGRRSSVSPPPGVWSGEEALDVLETVGLAERAGTLARELSHGDQRILELARHWPETRNSFSWTSQWPGCRLLSGSG